MSMRIAGTTFQVSDARRSYAGHEKNVTRRQEKS